MSENNQTPPFVLVDGSSYLFRAFHGMPAFTNSKGQDTGAIYGVINMLRSLISTYQPTHMAVIFDAKGRTFRDDIYPEYKAHRPPMPEELRSQIEPIHNIVRALGLPLLCVEGVEADDVIGTLAHQASAAGIETLISTGDKDMAQLVNEHVTLINTMTNQILTPAGVVEKFGIPPDLIIDFLALKGDKVDNIPGVPGVGDKSALGLLQGIGGIDAIYANLDKIKDLAFRGAKTMAQKMVEHEANARLSYTLATIKCDVPLTVAPSELTVDSADLTALADYYQEYEFKRWHSEVTTGGNVLSGKVQVKPMDSAAQPLVDQPAEKQVTSSQPIVNTVFDRTKYEVVTNETAFNDWLTKLTQADLFAFDTETTSLDYMQAELVGLSFCVAPNEACYIPVAHDYADAPEQLDRAWVVAQLKPLLENPQKKKITQHGKYDQNVLANYAITVRGLMYDTMLASYVLNAAGNKHDMDSLAFNHLGHTCISFEELAGKGAKQLTFNQLRIEDAAPYAAEDADVTFRLHQTLWPKLLATPKLANLYSQLEIPIANVLAQMEQNGVLINSQALQHQSQQLAMRIMEIEQAVHAMAGETFNLGSTKALQTILFEKMGLPVLKKTPKGAPSTAEEVLIELANDYELPALIMEYRGLSKLKNTYTDKLPHMINHRTGRVHTSYHQAVTATGRLSSSNPNLQNIPIRTAEGRRIREAFVARPGYQILAADYSQIELRIMAHISGDQGLLEAFQQGQDIHRATAAEVFQLPLAEVSSEQRRSAKAINFGLIYGMSAFGLAKQLNIGRTEAQGYIDQYFQRYPGVQEYMQATREQAKAQGYVETVLGRRLYLPDINASNGARRAGAERAAINAPMQGTAADIIKLAMLKVHEWINAEQSDDIMLIMQVHDELVFEVKTEQVAAYKEKVITLMQDACTLSVPLIVEAEVGENWEQAH